jgi:hypothetical protein
MRMYVSFQGIRQKLTKRDRTHNIILTSRAASARAIPEVSSRRLAPHLWPSQAATSAGSGDDTRPAEGEGHERAFPIDLRERQGTTLVGHGRVVEERMEVGQAWAAMAGGGAALSWRRHGTGGGVGHSGSDLALPRCCVVPTCYADVGPCFRI